MLIGPFDGRKKRSRCQACSNSHLKCSGQTPCSNCERRRIACTYGPARSGSPIILVERGRQKTIANWTAASSSSSSDKGKRKTCRPAAGVVVASSSPCRLITDDSLCYLYYFDVFVRSNSFTGKERTFGDEVKQLAGLHSGSFLMDAMLSLGAAQAAKLNATDVASPKECLATALEFYSKSIVGLRDALNARVKDDDKLRNTVLWTTLFLGVFELINDDTGDGWEQHMIHGTAKALEASGPASCRSGPSRRFFVQARIFEVSRTILSNETTFMTRPEWLDLSREMWIGQDGDEWRPLDSLLDIMVMISRMRVRACNFIEAQAKAPDTEASPEATSICADSYTLREALRSWYESYARPEATTHPQTYHGEDEDDSMLLSRVLFAAASIYLSGAFDYEITHWQRLRLVPSTLDERTIQQHTNTILNLASFALDTTSLSPLLFLFPLRIAGARSCRKWQRDWVAMLVDRIGDGFAVATAIRMQLSCVWRKFGLGVTGDDEPLQEALHVYDEGYDGY